MEMTFKDWLKAVDREMIAMSGLGHRDLADQTWRDWYDSEYTPFEAAMECLENEGFPT